jgi:hypothetical protein
MLKTILITVGCVVLGLAIYDLGIKKILGLNKYEEYEAYNKAA